MTDVSKEILDRWQVRKTRPQKTEFIDFMKRKFPDMKIKEGGRLIKSRNLVIGDVEKADFVLTAHYDTCAALPVPNIIAPLNFAFTLFYNIVICLPFFAVMAVTCWLLSFVIDGFLIRYWLSVVVMFALLFAVFLGGKPNRHTANDNTSGVITLVELMSCLSPDQKRRVAFVFFDNEENGMLGSAFFAKKYKHCMADKLVINFDCVSDGDNILVVLNESAKTQYAALVSDAFAPDNGKSAVVSSLAFYPSDQMMFPVSMAVAALKRKKGIGLYLDRIHTNRDTAFDESNLDYICEKTASLLADIAVWNQT